MAAGLSIRKENLESFAERFEAAVCQRTTPEDFIPETRVDLELPLDAVNDLLLADLEQMEPHGAGNPESIFLARDVVVQSTRIVGENHLRLFLRQGQRALSAIAFGMADQAVETGSKLDVLFTPEENEWNGSKSVQLRIRDMRPTRGA
ncbi:MAG TPA: hypothetical protein VMT89_02140, partial [Candidatus Acidoferrales bacterium]|nr:hypothetical protein [Candidatus Acidoferrales bacterium]